MKISAPSIVIAAYLGFGSLGATVARGQTVNPVPAPTMITTVPYIITTPGYYQAGANLNYNGTSLSGQSGIIEVRANNVTIDLGGHYLSGPQSTPGTTIYGIYATGLSQISVLNGTIANVYEGVKLLNCSNLLFQNVLFTHCYSFGIYIPSSSAVDILNCRITSIGGSTFLNNAWGIAANDSSSAVRISDCVVDTVTAANGGTAYGIQGTSTVFSRRNNISNCATGISGGKYQDNLTSNCTTTFTGGSDDGGNF